MNSLLKPRKQIISALLTIALAFIPVFAQQPITQTPPAPKPYEDRNKLEDLEDRSEDIANGILELAMAVRDGNTKKIAEYFDEGAKVTTLPSEATAAQPEVK